VTHDADLYGAPIQPVTLTDANIHLLAMHMRAWLPGELLLGPVERALREAIHATFPPTEAEG
jgi:hypothetical protein